MAIDKVGSVAGAGASPAIETGKESFGRALESLQRPGRPGASPQPRTQEPSEVQPRPVQDAHRAEAVSRVQPGATTRPPGLSEVRAARRVDGAANLRATEAARVLDQVTAAQRRLDQILEMAQAGRSFTPAELLAMQAHVYRASQELDLAGKVVEKATGGVKQVLQTQV